jgi:hypothetical protein
MILKRYIMLHHSLTKDSETVSWGAIEKYHRETNGWADIGYHYGVELIGSTCYGLVGRAEHRPAAACPQGDMNHLAIHVCLVGNFDLAEPPFDLLAVAINRIILPVMDRYGIVPERIVGHHDYNPAKSCPGAKFDLSLFRRILTGGST